MDDSGSIRMRVFEFSSVRFCSRHGKHGRSFNYIKRWKWNFDYNRSCLWVSFNLRILQSEWVRKTFLSEGGKGVAKGAFKFELFLGGDTIGIGSQNGTIYLFRVSRDGFSYKKQNKIRGNQPIIQLDWSSDGNYLQTTTSDYDLLYCEENFYYFRPFFFLFLLFHRYHVFFFN